jgi:hypothetical protein
MDPGVAAGDCGDQEGAVRDCYARLSTSGDPLRCLVGKQRCEHGQWSACGADGATVTQYDQPYTARGTLGILGNTPVPCDNPCNPSCNVFDNPDAGAVTGDKDGGVTYSGSSGEWGNSPGGFQGKQNCGKGGTQGTGVACDQGFPRDCNGAPTHYNKYDACQSDHWCDSVTGNCLRAGAGWTYPNGTCAGVDLTAGPTCDDGTGDGFPICNRGNTTLASGTVVKFLVDDGNKYAFPSATSCTKITTGLCTKTVPAGGLKPGECMRRKYGADAPDGNCTWPGNSIVYVNADLAIVECGMASAGTGTGVDATKPACFDNWSDIKSGSLCSTFTNALYTAKTRVETYVATCSNQKKPVWKSLGFVGTTPCNPGSPCTAMNASSIVFEAQTGQVGADGGGVNLSALKPVAKAPNPPFTQAANCPLFGGPAGCPVDVETALGADAKSPYLSLKMTVNPTPNGVATATLSYWQLTYECRDAL